MSDSAFRVTVESAAVPRVARMTTERRIAGVPE